MPINSFLYPGAKFTPAYEVANSLRFNKGSSDYLSKNTATATNAKKFTYSVWVKRGVLNPTDDSTAQRLYQGYADTNNRLYIQFNYSAEVIRIFGKTGGTTEIYWDSTKKFRDVSAWYHIVMSADSTLSTQADRMKVYVNNELIDSWSKTNSPSQNIDWGNQIAQTNGTLTIGADNTTSELFDGYMAEACFIDGQALDPTSFGEFDSDTNIWKPKDVSGLTFGNNGFYLDFEDSSALGNDVSGNNNDFTVNNLTSIDQSSDTCTNNFATMNPLDNYYQSATFSEGNLKIVTAGSTYTYNSSTFALSSGKWYCEIKVVSTDTNGRIGVAGILSTASTNEFGNGIYHWGYVSGTGQIENNNTHTSYGSSYTNGDIIGIYLDLDNNKLYFAKNGTIQNSGTGINITDPTNVTDGVYYIGVGETSGANSLTAEINFGNPTFSISSGNADVNGYGNFEYSPNDGGSASFDSSAKDFYALNTKNLAEYG